MDTKRRFSLFCWNIANPSIERAARQAEWLRKRPENIFVLTEAKKSEGCIFLERYFQAYGYNVIFPKPEEKEFGVIVVSKLPLTLSSFSESVNYLRSRVTSVIANLQGRKFEIIGLYVPSRDSSYEKTEKKKRFIQEIKRVLEANPRHPKRIFCGDFNVLEPDHNPRYPFFEEWEYDFYQSLSQYQLKDAFRQLNQGIQEYSWVGKTGDGYRYDHCFVSEQLLPLLGECYYFHELRQPQSKLSDHSALITVLRL